MEYARHEAMLNQPDKDGTPTRAHYEARASQGSKEAIEMIEGKDFPVDLEYLYSWSMQLVGRSGVSQAGLAPLSHSEIRSWSEMTGWRPDPQEVEALILLDSIIRHPDTETKKTEEAEDVPRLTPVAPWPVRKNVMGD
jgi:hypothetical protein